MTRLAQLLLLAAVGVFAYALGSATDGGRALLADAGKAVRGVWRSVQPQSPVMRHRFVDEIMPSEAAAQRIALLAPPLAGSVLMVGGRDRFLDHCAGFVGCVAVEYDHYGRFVHAVPFRPELYEAALVANGLAAPIGYERALGFDFARHADVFALDRYPNGDLAVVLDSELSFPPYLGIARVDRDGYPRWFRADGSHHWPRIAHDRLRGVGANLPDAVVVASVRMGLGASPASAKIPRQAEHLFGRTPCASHYLDYLQVLDGEGALLWHSNLEAALGETPHAALLAYKHNACDRLHINSVDVLPGTRLRGGIAAGDFLVSLHGVGALAVLDGRDGRFKRVWRGSFYGQHGARVLARPEESAVQAFLLFDNWGRGEYGKSRLLAFDPRSGRERTIYPRSPTPDVPAMYSKARGGVSIAPDGSRAIVHSYDDGRAVEVDLANGEVTAVFRSLDDVSALAAAAAPNRAYRWKMKDVIYAAGSAGGID